MQIQIQFMIMIDYEKIEFGRNRFTQQKTLCEKFSQKKSFNIKFLKTLLKQQYQTQEGNVLFH